MAAKTRVSVGDWPRLTRFYGITPLELLRTPNFLITLYAEQLSSLQGEEALLALQVSDFPHVTESSRRGIRESFLRLADYRPEPVKVDYKTDAGVGLLAAHGIGVVYEQTPNA